VSSSRRALAVTAAVTATLFVLLAIAMAAHPAPTAIEAAIDRLAVASRGSRGFASAKAVSMAGSYLAVAIGAAVLAVECWIRVGDRRLAIACVVAPGLAGLGEIVFKQIVGRPRPPRSVLVGESGFGFPSGHATGATALAICAVAVLWTVAHTRRSRITVGVGATVYVVVIGTTRVVLGAHHTLDVIGGWLLGTAIAVAVLLAMTRDHPSSTRRIFRNHSGSGATLGGVLPAEPKRTRDAGAGRRGREDGRRGDPTRPRGRGLRRRHRPGRQRGRVARRAAPL
jgi:undecaprenyl-diphosphatase